jgi:hypothetical protein
MVGSSRAIGYGQMGNESKLDVISSSEGSSCSSSSIVKHSIFSCLFSRTTIFHLSTFSAFLSSSASHQRLLPSLLPRSSAPSISDSKRSLGGAPHGPAVPISFSMFNPDCTSTATSTAISMSTLHARPRHPPLPVLISSISLLNEDVHADAHS